MDKPHADTPGPLETIRQRWAAHVQPRSIVVVDDLGGGVYGVRDLRPEEASLLRAPEDVAWLLAEVERLRGALIATEHEVCQTLGAALGYPHDPEGPGICVGDHVAASLAMEAALNLSRG